MHTKPNPMTVALRDFSKQYSGATAGLLADAANEIDRLHALTRPLRAPADHKSADAIERALAVANAEYPQDAAPVLAREVRRQRTVVTVMCAKLNDALNAKDKRASDSIVIDLLAAVQAEAFG